MICERQDQSSTFGGQQQMLSARSPYALEILDQNLSLYSGALRGGDKQLCIWTTSGPDMNSPEFAVLEMATPSASSSSENDRGMATTSLGENENSPQ